MTEQPVQAGERTRWWYFAAAAIMAIALGAYYVGLKSYSSSAGGSVLLGLFVTVLLLAGWAYRLRVADTRMAPFERTTLLTAAGLSVLTVLLHAFVVDDGLTVWSVITGVLPALPFGWLAARSLRALGAESLRE